VFTVELTDVSFVPEYSDITSPQSQDLIQRISNLLITQFNEGTFPFRLTSVVFFAFRFISYALIIHNILVADYQTLFL